MIVLSTLAVLAASFAEGVPIHMTDSVNGSSIEALPGMCKFDIDGLDLPGNDLRPVSTPTARECDFACYWDNDCWAWTWSDYQGGTCWLKATHGHGVVNDRAVSRVYFDCTTKYIMIDNCDTKGYDDFNRPGHSYLDCMGVTAQSFTWSDYNGGTCWFKTSYQRCEYAPNKFTGVVMK